MITYIRVTEYINFCVDAIVPSRTVKCFPKNKPWLTADLKELLNNKKRAFRNWDRNEQKRLQKELKMKLKESRGRSWRTNSSKIM